MVLTALYNGLREDFCVIADGERRNKSDLNKGTLWVSLGAKAFKLWCLINRTERCNNVPLRYRFSELR